MNTIFNLNNCITTITELINSQLILSKRNLSKLTKNISLLFCVLLLSANCFSAIITWTNNDATNGGGDDLSSNPAKCDIGEVPKTLDINNSTSLELDGVDDGIEICGSGSSFNLYPLTIEAWIKTSKVYASGGSNNVAGGIIADKYHPSSGNGWSFYVANGGILHAWYFSPQGDIYAAVGTTHVNDGNWHHVAFVVDIVGGDIYLDGNLEVSKPWNGVPSACTNSTKIARIGHGYKGSLGMYGDFDGLLDEVRIWNTVRTVGDLNTFMNTELSGNESGLVGYYKFDDVTELAGDCSAYNNYGTLIGQAQDNFDSPILTDVACAATGLGIPEINLQGNGQDITDGDNSASLSDDTDFDVVCIGNMETHSFTIQNTGTGNLVIPLGSMTISGTGANQFSFGTVILPLIIVPGSSEIFDINFSPTSAGLKSATINIGNNDCDEDPYNFLVKGTGPAICCTDDDGDGYNDISCGGTDCNDSDASINPGATEVCDGIDNDCDGMIDITDTDYFDDEDPTISCPADITLNADSGTCEATGVNLGTATATDNCATITPTNDAPSSYVLGVNTVTWTADDGHGNISTCTQIVNVEDSEDPVITCPTNITILTDTGVCVAEVSILTPVVSDNCTSLTLGNAMNLDGSDDHVKLPDAMRTQITQDITVEFWVKPEEFTNWHSYVHNMEWTGSIYSGYAIHNYSSTISATMMSAGNVNNQISAPAGSITLGVWHHIAMTYDGATLILYVNGIEVASKAVTGDIDYDPVPQGFNIGRYLDSNENRPINATMDEVRIWEVARSATEIIDNMNLSIGSGIGLVASYSFNQGIANGDNTSPAINTLIDAANGNDGVVTNLTLNGTESNWVEGTVPAGGLDVTNDYNNTANASDTYPIGTTNIVWTVTDATGNNSSCTQTVTVEDNEDPVITCPLDITVSTDTGACEATNVNLVLATVTDNCATITPTNDAPASYALGANTVIWTADDGNGNVVTCTQTVTVEDNEDPFVNCQDITVQLDTSGNYTLTPQSVLAPTTYNFTDATVSPNPSGGWIDIETADLNNDGHLDYMVVQQYNADQIFLGDGSGSFSLHQTIPTNQTNNSHAFDFRDLDGDSNLDIIHYNRHGTLRTFLNDGSANFTLNTSTSGSNARNGHSGDVDGDGDLDAFITHEAFSKLMLNDGSNSFVNSGQTFAPGKYDVRLIDLTGDGFPEIYAYDNTSSAIVLYINDGTGVFTQSTQTFAATGENQAGLADLDSDGDVDISVDGKVFFNDGSANFTDSGQTVPQEPILIDADGDGDMDIFGKLSGTSLYINDGTGNYTNSGYSGPGFGYKIGDVGDIDNDGDIDILLTWNSSVRFIRNDLIQSYGDNCDSSPVLTMDIDSLSCMNTESPVSVTVSIQDNSGNIANCISNVTVEDNTAPVAICQDITIHLDASGMASISAADVTDRAEDACGIDMTYIDLTDFTCANIGPNTVELTVIDNNGNISTCASTVTVQDTVPPAISCIDITISLDADGVAAITESDINGGATDACGILSTTISQDSFYCANEGRNDIILTITDVNNNVSTCIAEVTVIDTIAPVAICQNITVQLDANGNATITADDIDNGSNDACGIQSLEIDVTDFDCNVVGANTVELTVTDNNGNVNTCSATVTIEDNVPPIAICQDITIQLDTNGAASISGSDIDNGSNDACGIQSLSVDIETFTCANEGANTVTLTVEDNNGKISTCTSIVTVQDTVAPVAICQDITIQLDALGNATIGANDIDNGSSDACGIQSIVLDDYEFDCSDVGADIAANNYSIDFDGINDWVDATGNGGAKASATSLGLPVKDITLEVYVNVKTFGIWKSMVSFFQDNGSFERGWDLETYSADRFAFTLNSVGGGGALTYMPTNSSYNLDQWYHIAGVYDGTTMKIYVDGVLDGTSTAENGDIWYADSWLALGMYKDDNENNSLISGLDEVRIWNVARTQAEIQASMNSTLSGTEPGLVAYYAFEDGPGSTIVSDLSGNGHTGILMNMDPATDWIAGSTASGSGGGALVTMTVTDNNGNISTCAANVTVEDNIDPEAICQNLTIQLDANGNASITAEDVDNGSNDACGIESLEIDMTDFTCTNVGDNSVILTVTDINGNVSTCESTVTVQDKVDPIAICQDITIQLDETGNVSITTNDIDNGSSDACGFASLELDITDFDCSDVGTNAVVLTVTDNNNNAVACSSTVTVQDMVPPVAICQDLTIQLDAFGDATITPAMVDNGSNDACGILSKTLDITSFDCSNVGANTVTLTVTDINNNISTCTSTITIEDNLDPVALCQNMTVVLDNLGNGSITVADVNNGSNDACGIASITLENEDFTCIDVGDNTVTLTVTDNNNNVSTCTATITVVDNVIPVALCKDITIALDANGQTSIVPSDIDNGSNDACGLQPLAINVSDFDCSDVGDNTVILTATDVNGNVNTCESTVTVIDDILPTFSECPSDQTVDATLGSCSQAVSWTIPTVDDNCAVSQPVFTAPGINFSVFGPSVLGQFPVGTTTVTMTVTDEHNNVASCTFDITVEDNQSPIIANCPADIVVNNDAGLCDAEILYGVITASDNCPGVTLDAVSGHMVDGGIFPVGTTDVLFRATDAVGLITECSFSVTVIDNELPSVTCTDVTISLDNLGAGSISANDVFDNATDNCEVNLASLAVDVSTFGCTDVGTNTVTVSIEDIYGNVGTCTATVTVIDEVYPVALCNNITVDLDANGEATITVAQIDGGSNDACGIQSVTIDNDAFDCNDTGNNDVVLTVTDNNGNVSICTSVVAVQDVESPSITCPDNINVNNDTLSCGAIVDFTALADDNCGVVTTYSQNPMTFFQVGTTTVTVTATDPSGNETLCSFDVTVVDNELPAIDCPEDITLNTDAGTCTASLLLLPTVDISDNCEIASFTNDAQTSYPIGVNEIEYVLEDIHGNVSTCVQLITVIDNQVPTVVCNDITIDLPNRNDYTLTQADIDAIGLGSSDNCTDVSFAITAGITTYNCDDKGEVFTVTLTVTDNSGNQDICIANVSIIDSQSVCNDPPMALCQNIVSLTDENCEANIIADQIDGGSTDPDGDDLTITLDSYGPFGVGTHTVTLYATDGEYVDSCTATVQVVDFTPPTVVCQDITIQLDAAGNAGITANDVDGGSSDACGIENLEIDIESFTCSDVGNNAVTLTVTDENGMVNNCTATVTVEDNVNPIAICQDITVQLDAAGNVSITANDIDNGSNDACGIASLSIDMDSFTCAEVGANTVTLMVSDNNGNVSICASTVIVEDNIAPKVECLDITVQLDAGGSVTILPSDIASGPSGCSGTVTLYSGLNYTGNSITISAGIYDYPALNSTVGNDNTKSVKVNGDVNVELWEHNTPYNGQTFTGAHIVITTDTPILPFSGVSSAAVFCNQSGAPYDACGIDTQTIDVSTFSCANVGPNTVTLTVTDVNGNVSNCTSTVTVQDNVAPIAICQDITVQLDALGNASITPAQVDNGSNDACGIASLILDNTSFDCSSVGANTVTLTVTDVNGNASNCTSTITIEDNVNPVASCQDINLSLDAFGNASITADLIDGGSSDACGIDTLLIDISSVNCADVGPNTVILTAIDVNGNQSTCTATVNVEDKVAPIAICQDITIQLDAAGEASITADDVDNGSNDACGIQSLSINETEFNCFHVGDNTITFTVTDNNGNLSACTATVTVEDNVVPVAICQDITIQLNSSGLASISANNIDNGSNDACGISNLSIDTENFDCTHVGSNIVTLTVIDNNGNASMCTSNVTVEDNVDPIALCQNITVQLDANGNASITAENVNNGSNDACGIADLSIDVDAFTCANVGANTVVLIVTDNNGNESTCNATVTVQDNVDPIAICQDITIQLDASGAAVITPADVDNGSNDACGIQSLTINDDSFGCGDVGGNTVTLTVIDNNSNVSTCTSTVSVEDNIDPIAICQDITIQLDASGSANITAGDVDNGSNDACGIASLTIDDDSYGCGDVGVNTMTLTVTDNNGNVSICTSSVTVEDNVTPVSVCQDITVQLDASGNVSIIADDVDGDSNDACGIDNISIDNDTFTCTNVGNNAVTLTVTDVNGNVSDCTAIVTVEDNIDPVIDIAASNLTVECDGAGNATDLSNWLAANGNAMASDACGITWSNDYAALTNGCGATGSATVIFTATDNNGNSVSTSAIFTVEDTTAPNITCPSDMTSCADQGLVTGAVVIWVPVTSSDLCGTVTITSTHNSGDVFPVGTTTVTYTATDDCGNPTTCSFDVTVYELPEVVITEAEESVYCQGDYVILTANVTSNTGGISYVWSTGENAQSIDVNVTDTYTIVVTDSNGCTREAAYTVNVSQQNLLAAFTILAEKEAHLHGSNVVVNGGVGVFDFGGKAKIHSNSMVTGPTTFVKADIIQINSGSVVTTQISDPVNVSLPPFLNNTMPSNNDVTVSEYMTTTLSDQVYGDVKIKKGATVTFTEKDIFIDKLDIDDEATVIFAGCAFVRVEDKMDVDDDVTINSTGAQVWFYVDDKVDVGDGTEVNASIYALGHDIKVKGKSNNPTFMNGLFIGRKVHGDKYVTWDWGTSCDPGCVPEESIVVICDSYGEDSSNEWIESIEVNNTPYVSGNDGGYGDYRVTTLNLVTGNNNVELTPGFSGNSNNEYWKIWIDLNNDGDFYDSGEKVFSENSSSSIMGSLNIPNWVSGDTLTMRVTMKDCNGNDDDDDDENNSSCSNPCDIFQYGEVEDYSVVIDFCYNVINGGSIGEDQVLCEDDNDPAELDNLVSANGGSGAIEYLWLSTNDASVLPTITNMNGWTMLANSNSASYDPGPITETTYYLRCARRAGCIDYLGESNVLEVQYTSTCQIIYCDSYGDNSYYEWIEEVSFNNDDYNSGNDGGYGDYRSTIVPLTTGINAVELTPGFTSSSYHEYWTIWIDLNADGDFEDTDEEVFNGHGSNLVSGNMDIPLIAVSETTMRISMNYNGWSDPCEVFQYGEVEDYSVSISFCDNITDGGEIGTSTALCGDDNDPDEIASILDVDGGSGNIEYVWLYNTTTNSLPTYNSPNGWVEIPNSNSPAYDPGPITETTYYLRCARREGCNNYTGESNVVTITYAQSCQNEYCESEGQSTTYEWIQKVKVGSINNNSGDNGGYADYRNLSTSIAKGSSKTITLTPGFSGSKYKEYWRVWVDWNQDGDFNDSGEKEVQKASKNQVSKNISVPNNALVGTTTMRVSMKYGGYASPCNQFGEGEVEDYTINVVNSIDEEAGDIESRVYVEEEENVEELPVKMRAYPNPTREVLTIDFENVNTETAGLVIADMQGRVVRNETLDIFRKRSLKIDISNIPNGVYQLTMKFDTEMISKKIIKID